MKGEKETMQQMRRGRRKRGGKRRQGIERGGRMNASEKGHTHTHTHITYMCACVPACMLLYVCPTARLPASVFVIEAGIRAYKFCKRICIIIIYAVARGVKVKR